MPPFISITIAVVALAVFAWLSWGAVSGTGSEKEIDPTDSYQIGLLLGMTGGTITDAAVARFALERFEKTTGRKATTKDMGMVVGYMMESRKQ